MGNQLALLEARSRPFRQLATLEPLQELAEYAPVLSAEDRQAIADAMLGTFVHWDRMSQLIRMSVEAGRLEDAAADYWNLLVAGRRAMVALDRLIAEALPNKHH